MSRTIQITLDIEVNQLSLEQAVYMGFDREERNDFDIDLVDKDIVAEALVNFFKNFEFDEVACPNNWPWKITKLEQTL